jgi:SAM-dependent methyltransferase
MNVDDNLEEFSDPPNYDIEEDERSAPRIAFYCDLAQRIGGPVLELACGSGLVTLPVAAGGLEVTGVDLARPMLEHARKKAETQGLNIRWNDGERDHEKETHIACRFTYPQELQALLHYNGFQVMDQYRNWNQEALSASSPSIISICKVR